MYNLDHIAFSGFKPSLLQASEWLLIRISVLYPWKMVGVMSNRYDNNEKKMKKSGSYLHEKIASTPVLVLSYTQCATVLSTSVRFEPFNRCFVR